MMEIYDIITDNVNIDISLINNYVISLEYQWSYYMYVYIYINNISFIFSRWRISFISPNTSPPVERVSQRKS